MLESIFHIKENGCRLEVPWKSRYPATLSFAFDKGSPYYPFFQYRLLSLNEEGTLQLVKNKWMDQMKEECREESFNYLGIEQVTNLIGSQSFDAKLHFIQTFGLFLLLLGSYVLSSLFFFLECGFRKKAKEGEIKTTKNCEENLALDVANLIRLHGRKNVQMALKRFA